MRINFTLLTATILLGLSQAKAGTFTSVTTGNYSTASTWSFTGDADGIPDADDNVTIVSGHTVTINTLLSECTDITVNAGATLDVQRTLYISGNYTMNGTESGSAATGGIYFRGIGKTIGGTGTFNTTLKIYFLSLCNLTITAGTTIYKSSNITIYSNTTVTNQGNFTASTVVKAYSYTTGYTFINGATGTLTLRARNFFAGGTFTCSAAGNTVKINYSSDPLPSPTGNNYYDLIIVSPNTSLSATTNVARDFTINASGSISQNNQDLNIARNFSRAGGWTPSATGTVTMNGTAAQNITNSASSVMQFQKLTINNPTTVTLNSGSYEVYNTLTVSQGTFNSNSRPITLKSDAATTAVIGNGNGTISGSFTLERYIAARAAGYSDMSSSVISSNFTDWDNELLLVYVYNPPSFYPSAYSYDESLYDYVAVQNAGDALYQGVGYEVYLDSDGNQTTFNATTVNTVGTPTTGSVDISGTVTATVDGWNLVGNPYHANLNWDLFQAVNSVNTGFQYYDEILQDFATGSTGSGELLAPNQGFWIEYLGGACSFQENQKSASTSSTFRSKEKIKNFTVRLKSVGGTTMTCGTEYRFINDMSLANNMSMIKRPRTGAPILASLSNNKKLKITDLNTNENTLEIPLYFEVANDGIYSISPENIFNAIENGYSCIQLIDHKTGKEISLTESEYQFFASQNDQENRFSIKLSKTDCEAQVSLAVTSNIDINRNGDKTVVKFNFDEESTARIVILNALGQEIVPATLAIAGKNIISVQMPNDYSGIYIVTVYSGNNSVTKKLYK